MVARDPVGSSNSTYLQVLFFPSHLLSSLYFLSFLLPSLTAFIFCPFHFLLLCFLLFFDSLGTDQKKCSFPFPLFVISGRWVKSQLWVYMYIPWLFLTFLARITSLWSEDWGLGPGWLFQFIPPYGESKRQCGIEKSPKGMVMEGLGFISRPCSLQPVWSWVNCLCTLRFNFISCKIKHLCNMASTFIPLANCQSSMLSHLFTYWMNFMKYTSPTST